LHVHGANGVYVIPQNQSMVSYKPPAVIELSDKDQFMIRKKLFRFEYPSPSTALPSSPLPASPKASPKNVKPRRASHRMSLVPAGKTFVPMSPAKGIQEESIEAEDGVVEEGQSVVDVVDGEEGDVVYMEVKEELVAKVSYPSSRLMIAHFRKLLHDASTEAQSTFAKYICSSSNTQN
jgi:hypothetical protein